MRKYVSNFTIVPFSKFGILKKKKKKSQKQKQKKPVLFKIMIPEETFKSVETDIFKTFFLKYVP